MFLNLTSHEICLPNMTIPPSGTEVSIFPHNREVGLVHGVSTVVTEFDDTEVTRVAGEIFKALDGSGCNQAIVSPLVLLALRGIEVVEELVVTPDTSQGSVVRDANGYIISFKRLQVNP